MSFNKLLQQSLLWRGFYFFTVLLLNIVVSRFLHADGSGWLYFFTNVFTLIITIASFNLESGFTFFASSNKIPHNSLATLGMVWSVLISTIIIIPMYYYAQSNTQFTNSISPLRFTYYGGCFILGILLTTYFTVLFYSKSNFYIPNLWLGISNVVLISILCTQVFLHTIPNTILTIYFLFYPIQGIGLVILFLWMNKGAEKLTLPNNNNLLALYRYSAIALGGNLLFFLLYKVDYFFVKNYCSASDLGNYIQASKLGQMLLIIPQIFASAVFPQIASGQLKQDVNNAIIKLTRLFLQLFFVLFLLLALIGKWLFPFMFGSSFASMYTPMLIVILGVYSLSVLVLLTSFFSGNNKPHLNSIGAAIGLFVAIIGYCIFVPTQGIIGAAYVSSFAYGCYLLYALYQFKKMHPFKLIELISFRKTDWTWMLEILLHK